MGDCGNALMVIVFSGMVATGADFAGPDSTSDSSAVFELGKMVVTGQREGVVSLTSTVPSSVMEEHEVHTVADAVNLLPGVSLSTVGARFETGVMVRGFDLRQIPLYVDGIPVYVPYDGYVDLGRFTTADAAEIRVDKGYSSVLSGPNALGGTINVISRKPVDKFELGLVAGMLGYKPVPDEISDLPVAEGNRLSLHLGSRLSDAWYMMAGGSALLQDAFNLSRDFRATANQQNGVRNQSYQRDVKTSARIGFTPSDGAEYALSWAWQHAEKGGPLYAGPDASVKPRYWRWPYWDKQSIYLYNRTPIGATEYVKVPLYLDRFRNSLYSYDDAAYTSFKKPYAFKSWYDDYTAGGGIEAGSSRFAHNDLRASSNVKRDFHSELNSNDTAKSADRTAFVDETKRYFIDNTFHTGIEDGIDLVNGKVNINAGAAFACRAAQRADDYFKYHTVTDRSTGTTTFVPDSVAPFPQSRASAWNLQAAVTYHPAEHHGVNLSVARKTRFPTIKDRYSYRLGTAYPNPELEPEAALHCETGYSGDISFSGMSLGMQCNLFYIFIDNVIQSVTVDAAAPDSGTKTQMRNAGRARAGGHGNLPGLEIAARFTPVKNRYLMQRLDIDGSYSYTDKRNVSDPSLVFTDMPVQKALASLRWAPLRHTWLFSSFEWNSRRWIDSRGDRSLAGYRLVNVKGCAGLGSSAMMEAGVNNVFDVNYSLQDGYPEEGRTFYTTLRMNVGRK